MTEEMKNFLRELADLMEKHNVEAEVTEDTHGYYNMVEGLEFYIESKYDYEKDIKVRDQCDFNVGRCFDASDIRDYVNDEEN